MIDDTHSIAPYSGETFRKALQRVLGNPMVPEIMRVYFPQIPAEKVLAMAAPIANADALQKAFVDPFINALLEKTSSGLTIHGLEKLVAGDAYTFLSTHRDIVLDPGLFAWALFRHGLRTPQICLGDNLLGELWVEDLMKLNKGVTVKRSATSRELLRWSQALSGYIREQIESKVDSVWIAHREGRAKDGDDRTQPGVLKMLALSGEGTLPHRLSGLRPVPIAISYEFQPCDTLLARELYLTEQDGVYHKQPKEDAQSMRSSFGGWKGGVRIDIGEPLEDLLTEVIALPNRNEQARALAVALDERLHRLFHLWPSNYIACDLYQERATPSADYTESARTQFVERMNKRIAAVSTSKEETAGIRKFFLRAYANPVLNRRQLSV